MKILIRGTNWIGDAVMTIPAMRELRRLFPDAEITLYTRAWAEGLFRDVDFIDRILTVEDTGSNFRDTLAEARRLKKDEFDMAVLLTNSFQSAAVIRLAGIPRRFGYAREGRGVLLSDSIRVPKWKDERHQSFYYLNIIEQIENGVLGSHTVKNRKPKYELTVADKRRSDARSMLEDAGVDTTKKTVAFGAGSTNSMAKRWGEAKFAEVGRRVQSELGANVILLGSESEMQISQIVSALSEADFIDLTGTTDLAEVTAILSETDVFVSNDMGLAHIAAAVGTKTVVIFGPTNDVTTRPLGNNVEVIRHPVECSPCMLRECPIDHRCMTRVSVDEVFEKVKREFNAKTPKREDAKV